MLIGRGRDQGRRGEHGVASTGATPVIEPLRVSIDLACSAEHAFATWTERPKAGKRTAGRRWGMKDITVLWISMSACIPTYMLASGLIDQGMNWWQAVLTIFLGNLVVLVPMVLNAHAGTKYGIPFPVYCRAAFGILGANVPALMGNMALTTDQEAK